jgi:hypothetical protein
MVRFVLSCMDLQPWAGTHRVRLCFNMLCDAWNLLLVVDGRAVVLWMLDCSQDVMPLQLFWAFVLCKRRQVGCR